LYLRSDLRYLLAVFVSIKASYPVSEQDTVLAIVYSTVKFLPLKFSMKGLIFSRNVNYDSAEGAFYCPYQGSQSVAPATSFECTAITSFQVFDLQELGPEVEISVPTSCTGFLYGSSSLVFDFASV